MHAPAEQGVIHSVPKNRPTLLLKIWTNLHTPSYMDSLVSQPATVVKLLSCCRPAFVAPSVVYHHHDNHAASPGCKGTYALASQLSDSPCSSKLSDHSGHTSAPCAPQVSHHSSHTQHHLQDADQECCWMLLLLLWSYCCSRC